VSRSWALLALVSATAAFADVESWVKEQVRTQKEALAKRSPVVASDAGLFREADPDEPSKIPGFRAPKSLAPLVNAVRPGVVNIATANGGASQSLGSGFLLSPDGYCVTNNHVIERAQLIRVRLADGREFSADVVGKDPSTDLALLKLSGEGVGKLPTVVLGDSDQLEVGDWVVAIGNPFGLDTSVTHGIISARERVIGVGPFDDFIQTNATINPGNSGGPLFDMKGQVVGVTTAIVSQGQGIGFAVPINLVKDLLPNLRANGHLARGWLGINVHDRVSDKGEHAAIILDVFKSSPADRAGIKPGDRLVAVSGRQVDSYTQLLRRIALLAPGTKVKIKYARDGKEKEVEAMLADRPGGEVMEVLAGTGRVSQLGLVLKNLTPAAAKQLGAEGGVLVALVAPDGPAAIAGISAGDLLVEVNRKRATDVDTVRSLIQGVTEGGQVLLKVQRGDSARLIAVRI
jgi:serine protease Do